MSFVKNSLFSAFFIATFMTLPCFARASRFTSFLDEKEHAHRGQHNRIRYNFKPAFTKAYHTVKVFYFSNAARRYEKKSNAHGMRAAWIGIGLGSESEFVTYNQHRVADPTMNKPFFFTQPFIQAWKVKNTIFNSLASYYRRLGTENYDRAKNAFEKAEYHKKQLAALTKKAT